MSRIQYRIEIDKEEAFHERNFVGVRFTDISGAHTIQAYCHITQVSTIIKSAIDSEIIRILNPIPKGGMEG